MNVFRAGCFAVALLSIAATGDPCDDTGSSGSSTTVTSVGANGAACESTTSEGVDGTPCCGSVNDPCQNDYECCTGNCGNSFGDGGSSCGDPSVSTCLDGLSSRCLTGECECMTDDDCCIGVCAPTAIPGTGPATTLRCCQPAGQPCGTNADCCDLTCSDDTDQCE
jgi:hypothetical protein